ncbi:DUF3892 domain-containing protein [Commensalibacter nepenthis]|uniref:DUF3892 domain-containing protein n=1 Tax=Commensalibacter nepenthis TaxID=3043872 RepID=A0ABT6QBS9_9PROT|nr:DUF3892 domain-containing protein [Commensalibacter sp. TBRC 10068]MDI2113790.1 DUF3892 domain-containing protein [Commensalibacter sp. TBRC 10068]
MSDVPDFYITGVRYGDDECISHVRVALHFVTSTGEIKMKRPVLVPREFIVDLLQTGKIIFYTATLDKSKNTYQRGENVSLYDEQYITTDPNGSTKDNLEGLPKV